MFISVSSVLRQLKKYLAVWIAAAIIAGILGVVLSAVKTFSVKTPARALVSFTYPNIEKGLDPAGRKFEIESMKNPVIIERTLTELGIELDKVEDVRSNISFDYKIPDDAYDKLTAYNSVMDKATSGSLSAAQAMLDTKYYPTQFTVYFDFGEAGFDRKTGVEVLNTLLENYRDYFYEQYGYNEPLGAAVNAADYESYDYAQQVDLFRDSLRQVRSYLNSLSRDDNTTFRSSITGYSFKDLSEYAKTVSSIDLDRISSYISINNVTKDKDAAIAYYDYRIENLKRDEVEYKERIASIDASIDRYKKDSILIFGNGTDTTNTEYATHSEQYDLLFKQKTTADANLAQTKQDINYYESRRAALQNNKNSSEANVKKVEADIASLSEKVKQIVELTENTADDYYENVQFAHAYNILIPATRSVSAGIGSAISNAIKPLVVIELLIFVIYMMIVFISALKYEAAKNRVIKKIIGDDDENEEEISVEEFTEMIEEELDKDDEKSESDEKTSKPATNNKNKKKKK
jgi:hypothetical protein